MSNLAEQIREALSMFERNGTQPALIGGLAVVRTRWCARLLAQAAERETPMGRMRIINVEGLIGFKLQGFVNDATRTRDLDDIHSIGASVNGCQAMQSPVMDRHTLRPCVATGIWHARWQ